MDLTELLPQIYERCTDVPRVTATRRLVEAARDFCNRTEAWRENVQVPLVADQAEYTLDMPEDPAAPGTPVAQLRRVHQVKRMDRDEWLEKRTEVQMELQGRSSDGTPLQIYTQPKADQIKLYGTPPAALAGSNVTVHASFSPNRTAGFVPDDVGERYYETLVDGALSLLYAMPDEKWTDVNRSKAYGSKYQAATEEARIEVDHEYSQRVVRVIGYGGI